ncbi:MAG TPA: T9SS type A sorting domain-containing protein, partial [Chitinophagaceae bacterium]|nr:T9SS type A sorting domain-containing protein [Chitinophagaceae bacterium]
GARFSTVAYSYFNPVPIDNFSQIESDSVITDTSNWVQISGSFIADSLYQYLSIGNFFVDSLTLHFTSDSTASIAYYYVDNISVSLDTSNDGVEEESKGTIIFFPNPAQSWIVIENRSIDAISILDLIGRTVIENSQLNNYLNIVDLETLPKGIYLLKVETSKGIYIHKIIHY